MSATSSVTSMSTTTPVNTISRDNLTVLIRNNGMNDSLDFISDCCDNSGMDTDSPVREPSLQPISKRLFHSPMSGCSPNNKGGAYTRNAAERTRRTNKRKQSLIPDSGEKIKRAYVQESEGDSYSPEVRGGMRKKVLISLFHNKEYSMDFS